MTREPRKRRRAKRLSTATDYDRTADRPSRLLHGTLDDDSRTVNLDDDTYGGAVEETENPYGGSTGESSLEEGSMDEAFYKEERPPHHGG